MQVEAAVDEADVGRLREDMSATFTVDAFPGRTFRGQISQIRKAAQVVSNVVSYTTIITVPNADLTLLPGMTANVRIQTDRREDVVRVANAALRFRPADSADAGGTARAAPAPTMPAGAPVWRSGWAGWRGRTGRRRGRWRGRRRTPRDADEPRAGPCPYRGSADQARRDSGGGAPGVRGRAEPGW